MTTEESLNQINTTLWTIDEFNTLHFIIDNPLPHFTDQHSTKHSIPLQIHCYLSKRPYYCDRGHLQLDIEAPYMNLDHADSFPRYFWTFHEADTHTRAFLRWRLHKVRTFTRQQILDGSPWSQRTYR